MFSGSITRRSNALNFFSLLKDSPELIPLLLSKIKTIPTQIERAKFAEMIQSGKHNIKPYLEKELHPESNLVETKRLLDVLEILTKAPVPFYEKLLDHKSLEIKEIVIKKMENRPKAEVLGVLSKLLESRDLKLQTQAIIALGNLKASEVMDSLVQNSAKFGKS